MGNMSNEVKGIIIKNEERQRYYFDYGGKPVEVMVNVAAYAANGGLAMILEAVEETGSVEPGEEFYLTVNFKEPLPAPNMAYIDVNNMGSQAAAFLEKYGLARNTGRTRKSGYVTYPLFEFDLQKLRRLRRENEAFMSEEDCAIDTIGQFCQAVCKRLNEKMDREGLFRIVAYECDCAIRYSISMELDGWGIAPKAEMEHLWERYDYIGNMELLIEQVLKGFMDFKEMLDGEEKWDTTDVGAIREHIGFRLVNPEYLPEEAAHVPYKGMEVIFDVHLVPSMGINFEVSEQDLKNWGLEPEEGFELAKRNMSRLLPAMAVNLENIHTPLPYDTYPVNSEEGMELLKQKNMEFILSNETERYGAGTIFYPGIAKHMAEQMQCNFYILLPTVHEAMILPEALIPEGDTKELQECVKSLCVHGMPEEDRLSQTVYYYDAEKDEISAVE